MMDLLDAYKHRSIVVKVGMGATIHAISVLIDAVAGIGAVVAVDRHNPIILSLNHITDSMNLAIIMEGGVL